MRECDLGEAVVFGQFVIAYLFLGGLGSGMLLTASLWSLLFHARADRTRRESEAFRLFRDRCVLAGLAFAAVGALCLLADLGRPELFILLFLRPHAAWLTFGSFALAGLLAAAAFLAVANYCRLSWVTTRVKAAAELVCVVFSLAVMAYTGFFLRGLDAVAFWDTWLLPALFMLSSASMGISACLMVGALLRDFWMLRSSAPALHRVHLAVLVLEAVALAAFLALAANGRGAAPESFMLLFSEPLLPWFALGLLGCGIVLPLASEAALVLRGAFAAAPLADLLCICGGLALRVCVVAAGLH